MTTTPQRIDALEAKLAFQEDTITTLNEALIGQQTRIDRMEQLLNALIRKLEQIDNIDAPPQVDPPPPHY